VAQAKQRIILRTYTYPTAPADRQQVALVVCECPDGEERARAWRGLPPDAEGLTLKNVRPMGGQSAAVLAVDEIRQGWRGWLTLVGDYGVGKTQILYVALNELAALGVHGQYWTMPRVLDYLRDALLERDQRGRSHSQRLDELVAVPVLALDELDKYHQTDYAESVVFRLLDARYQRRESQVTILAYNRDRADRLPPFLTSRMRDSRFKLIDMGAVDLRPLKKPGAAQPAPVPHADRFDRGPEEHPDATRDHHRGGGRRLRRDGG
jgi:hypothetical protein